MSEALNNALEKLFSLPNWENRGDHPDVGQALKEVHAAFVREKQEVAFTWLDPQFQKRCPAVAALKDTDQPKPDHLRACVLELARWVTRKERNP